MNSRRKFLQAISGTVGGFLFAPTPEASAKEKIVTILHGSGPPRRRTGIVGDFYIDGRSHSIYGPKTANGWGRPTKLVGPTGPPGSTGPTGAGGDIPLIDGGSL